MKKGNIFFHKISGIILCYLLLLYWVLNPIGTFWLDNIFFLEDGSPGYWEHLNEKNAIVQYMPSDAEKISGSEYRITNAVSTITGNGYIIRTNIDGSITFCGTNEGDKRAYHSFCLGKSGAVLPDGDYLFTDGGVSSTQDIFMYVEGVSYGIGGLTMRQGLASPVWEDYRRSFSTNQEQFYRYNCVMTVDAGFSSDGITFYPMILRTDKTSEFYITPVMSSHLFEETGENSIPYQRYITDMEGLSKLSIRDWQLLEHSLRGYRKQYMWTTFDFGDGTGIEIVECNLKSAKYGELDTYGRVERPVELLDLLQEGAVAKLAESLRNNCELRDMLRFDSYLRMLKDRILHNFQKFLMIWVVHITHIHKPFVHAYFLPRLEWT